MVHAGCWMKNSWWRFGGDGSTRTGLFVMRLTNAEEEDGGRGTARSAEEMECMYTWMFFFVVLQAPVGSRMPSAPASLLPGSIHSFDRAVFVSCVLLDFGRRWRVLANLVLSSVGRVSCLFFRFAMCLLPVMLCLVFCLCLCVPAGGM